MPHSAGGVADFRVLGADAMEDYEPPNPTDFKLEAKPRPITTVTKTTIPFAISSRFTTGVSM